VCVCVRALKCVCVFKLSGSVPFGLSAASGNYLLVIKRVTKKSLSFTVVVEIMLNVLLGSFFFFCFFPFLRTRHVYERDPTYHI
jgi:hypothetical protein